MNLSNDQQIFFDAVMNGENVFLSGKAGTGKSFITKHVIKELQKRNKNVIALAPTGIAANNIKGATIHSTFALSPFGVLSYKECNFLKQTKRLVLNNTDVIFIDEVSMLRPDILDAINWTLIKNGCKRLDEMQIVLIGDMAQLGIVADDNMISVMLRYFGGTDFTYASIYESLNIKNIELSEVLRQSDNDFIENLNFIREGKKSEYFKQFVKEYPVGIILAPHNSTVQSYNNKGFELVEGKTYTFTAIVEGNIKAADFNLEPIIKVKDGCKIMYLANSKNNNLINGTLGIFRAKENHYFIDVDGVYYALEQKIFSKKDYVFNKQKNSLELTDLGTITQIPIKLAYALTIHKSQGLTFNDVTVDLTLPCFAKGQMYVALSRVKTPLGLTIITKKQ